MSEAIVLLVLLWAVLLLPRALRSRGASPHTTVGGFERAMDVLRNKPGSGRELMVPGDAGRIVSHGLTREPAEPGRRGEDRLMARRRTWFLRALAATAATLVLALVLGRWLWPAFVVLAAVTGGYTVLLRRLKLQRDQARQVVRGLELRRADDAAVTAPPPPEQSEPDDVAVGADSSVRLRRWDG